MNKKSIDVVNCIKWMFFVSISREMLVLKKKEMIKKGDKKIYLDQQKSEV